MLQENEWRIQLMPIVVGMLEARTNANEVSGSLRNIDQVIDRGTIAGGDFE